MIKKDFILTALSVITLSVGAQTHVPCSEKEDVEDIMSHEYWAVWNDEAQSKIDQDIERYRKGDATFNVGKIKKGSKVKVEQISSDFVFGASAFNFNQLGSKEANARYRELFGTLFNRATVPFYWRTFEPLPDAPRFKESLIDKEEWWNKMSNMAKMQQRHWRRPVTDPIVTWCKSRCVAVHGHPLVWENRKWMYPEWLQNEGIPENERRALDSLEILSFKDNADKCASYQKMTAQEIVDLVPTYLKNQEKRTLERIGRLMNHYKGVIDSWDVVNESAVDYGSGVQSPELPMCKSQYGIVFSDYTYKSFKEAEKNDYGTLLNINDYVTDSRYIDQVKDLLKRGCKIDVVGSQMHLFNPQQCLDIAAGKNKELYPENVRKLFARLATLGRPTCVSEITITSAGEGHKGEMIQAIIARNLYRVWFSIPSMMGITWWNLVDNCGAPGEPTISGLFNRDMTPKEVYFMMNDLLTKEWRTNLEILPQKGKISWRGFKGNYRITWTDSKGVSHQEMVALK